MCWQCRAWRERRPPANFGGCPGPLLAARSSSAAHSRSWMSQSFDPFRHGYVQVSGGVGVLLLRACGFNMPHVAYYRNCKSILLIFPSFECYVCFYSVYTFWEHRKT